jgi:3-hydroxybutyryl-CoA dehydratase
LDGMFFEDLRIGQTASVGKTISEADILLYTAVSSDTNPLHLDAEYAATTKFGARIAHGMLSAGLISAVLGTRLPGPGTVYIAQNLRFLSPVFIGDTVIATVEVAELLAEKFRARLATRCTVAGKTVIEGEALVVLPRRPGA